jgi:hypothetical protein
MPALPHHSLCTLVVSAVVIGVISALVLKGQISRIIRSFDRHLFWTYCRLFKEKGWEIFWGPTVFGIIFGLATLWYSPLKVWFLTYLLTVFFMTGYYLWRDDYTRLQPQFKVEKIIAQITDTEDPSITNIFLQVLPECLTDAPVFECRARLLLVSKLDGHGNWLPTQMNSPLKLGWDYYGYEPLTIEPGIGQRLNICWWDNKFTAVIPTVDPMPSKIRGIMGPGPFKFDIRMSAKDCSPIDFSVTVNLLGRKWDDPQYILLQKGQKDDTKYFNGE